MSDPSRTTRRRSESAEVNSAPTSAHRNEASGGRQRRGGRVPRGGSHRRGNHYQPPFIGPYSELSTAPMGFFDIPPPLLPANIFNANLVPVSAAPNTVFANHARNTSSPFRAQNANREESIDQLEGEFERFGMQGRGNAHSTSNIRSIRIPPSDHGSETAQRGRFAQWRRGSRGSTPRRASRGFARHLQRQSNEDLTSFYDANIQMPVEEGYGCPPSYLMESYREESDRQEVAVAAAILNRERRGGKQIFPGRRRSQSYYHNNVGTTHITQHRIRDNHDDNSFDTLRDRLKKQLENDCYECMICCQTIQPNQWIWTCSQCFHMFHMNRANTYGCITQWAAKSFDPELGWRCPSCQNLSYELPKQYRCFCGKRLNPPTQRFPDMPHSCNATCGKSRGFGCPHPCSEQCHPGPCPECPSMVTRTCNCGAETRAIRCGKMPEFQCAKVCGKTLNCGIHTCNQICHKGDCGICEEIIIQNCYCGADERTVACTAANLQTNSYSCGAPCQGMFACGIHSCDLRCHPKKAEGNCGPCSLSPEKREFCPCGRARIDQLIDSPRKACTDPIPTCNNICGKVLPCGPKEKPHRCKQLCHMGACSPCPDNSSIVCRCKALKKNISCKEFILYSESNPFTCERRCRKLKSCQNHRCQAMCCIDKEHVCMQICNKKLECGNHNCDRLCHVGQCPRCLQASFEEQYCLCGHTVREPPIPCGTPLPPCDQPCSRQHACDHPPMHNCHAEPECPPCTVLTEKSCYCGREVRANIPCYLNDVSCGRPCEKELPCGIHLCKRICHLGPCLTPENPVCKQPCTVRRTQGACDHICGLSCHGTEPCPKSVCTYKVIVTCACLRKTTEMRCIDVERTYQKTLAVNVAEACEETPTAQKRILKRSPSVDKYQCIPCDAECHRILRNKRVANALNIATDSESNNLSLSEGMVPVYTDFLRLQLKNSSKQVLEIENALIELVHSAELQQNGTTRTHTFRPMTSENRRIIHEYASYFHIETISYDAEPQRNVVATAKSGSCCVPLILLTQLNNPTANPNTVPSTNAQNKNTSSLLPSVEKDFSWNNTSSMHQLKSAGKVMKRGFADAARSAQK
uniref:NF-X1-type domain-containing protein n=1 Tax=Parascaris univalens TaxID=6257 RepID=A0A915AKK1_PARUN